MATPSTQIIPSTELTGIENAIGELSVQTALLPELKRQADELQVTDENSYTQAAMLRKQTEAVGGQGEDRIGPFTKKLKQASDFLKLIVTAHKNQAEQIDGILSQKMSTYLGDKERRRREEERQRNEANQKAAKEKAEAERKAADEEAERVRKANEKAIKEAQRSGEVNKTEAKKLLKESEQHVEQMKKDAEEKAKVTERVAPVKVQSEVPALEGFQRRSNWKFTVKNIDQIPRHLLYPRKGTQGEYKPGDFPLIGELVRNEKNKAKAEALCPGIEVTEDIKV